MSKFIGYFILVILGLSLLTITTVAIGFVNSLLLWGGCSLFTFLLSLAINLIEKPKK